MITTTKTIKLYNLDNSISASKWIREEIKSPSSPKIIKPHLSSAINISDKSNQRVIEKDFLGCYVNMSNNVYENSSGVFLLSSIGTRGNANISLSVIPENFMKVCALFTARKSIKSNWINQKDEYSAPNTDHEDYEQWNNDTVVYSLFNTSSNQSSLRDVEYKGETWQIENEFFFMSHEEIKELADKYSYGECYNDVKQYGKDRYVYKLLSSLSLSDDAKEVLEMAKDMVRKTFEYRELMNEEHPEYNLQAWDTGWYQIKLIAKEYCNDELKKFNEKYKEFENRMREGVYTFEFLKR